jgi:hypothetical protein
MALRGIPLKTASISRKTHPREKMSDFLPRGRYFAVSGEK